MSQGTPDGTEWTLQPGDQIERKQLHNIYGGRAQGGIGPSAKSPNVLIFTDPVAGEKHGYYDDWMPDGCFHYTGEGQRGDQRMISGNSSILNHQEESRALRVFQGARGTVTYVGEFMIDQKDPFYEADAPETAGGPLRKVIIFRLRPVDISPQSPATRLGRLKREVSEVVDELPMEHNATEQSFVDPNREFSAAEQKVVGLLQVFADHLASKGFQSCRQQIFPPGESRPLFTDLYSKQLGLLVAAKGSVTRENVRMAIGQLADYSRFVEHNVRALLLPSKPRSDLLALAQSQECAVIWPEGEGYASTNPQAIP